MMSRNNRQTLLDLAQKGDESSEQIIVTVADTVSARSRNSSTILHQNMNGDKVHQTSVNSSSKKSSTTHQSQQKAGGAQAGGGALSVDPSLPHHTSPPPNAHPRSPQDSNGAPPQIIDHQHHTGTDTTTTPNHGATSNTADRSTTTTTNGTSAPTPPPPSLTTIDMATGVTSFVNSKRAWQSMADEGSLEDLYHSSSEAPVGCSPPSSPSDIPRAGSAPVLGYVKATPHTSSPAPPHPQYHHNSTTHPHATPPSRGVGVAGGVEDDGGVSSNPRPPVPLIEEPAVAVAVDALTECTTDGGQDNSTTDVLHISSAITSTLSSSHHSGAASGGQGGSSGSGGAGSGDGSSGSSVPLSPDSYDDVSASSSSMMRSSGDQSSSIDESSSSSYPATSASSSSPAAAAAAVVAGAPGAANTNTTSSMMSHPAGAAIATISAATDAMQVRYDSSTGGVASVELRTSNELRARELLNASSLLPPSGANNGSNTTSSNQLTVSTESQKSMASSVESMSSSTSTNKSSSKGSSDKKKKGTSWYNVRVLSMLSPTYKSRSEEFRRYFKDIPMNDRLIVDYSCALQKDILVHGRIYISQRHVSFYANIFRWETAVTIRCKDIVSLTKERTARVIPNAIQITTENEKYFFTTFGTRDKTYLMLFRVWQNALMEQPMSPQELWQWVHYNYGDDLGLTSEDDDYTPPTQEDELQFKTQLEMVESGNFEVGTGSEEIKIAQDAEALLLNGEVPMTTTSAADESSSSLSYTHYNNQYVYDAASTGNKKNKNAGTADKSTSRVGGRGAGEGDGEVNDGSGIGEGGSSSSQTRTTGVPTVLRLPVASTAAAAGNNAETLSDVAHDSTDDSIGEELECSGHDHYPIISLDQVFHMTCDQMFNTLFTEGEFIQRFNKARKTSELSMPQWPEEFESDDTKSRIIQYNLTITFSLGTKISYTTEKQTLYKDKSSSPQYMIDTEVNNAAIPYADSFYVANKYCINRVSARKCRLRVSNEIRYKKNVWGLVKSFIEKNTSAGVIEHFIMLAEYLRRESSGESQMRSLSPPCSGTEQRKKVLRKRRSNTATGGSGSGGGGGGGSGSAASTQHNTTAAHGATHVTNSKGNHTPSDDLPFNFNMDSLIKMVFALLLLLIIFNALLFYKLLSLEQRSAIPYYQRADILAQLKNQPTTVQDWAELLEQQQYLHDAEIDRWKDVLVAAITVMDQMKLTLVDLQESIDRRSKFMAQLKATEEAQAKAEQTAKEQTDGG